MKKIILYIAIFLIISFGIYYIFNFISNQNYFKKIESEKEKYNLINEHYNNYVITNKKTNLFEFNEKTNKYTKIGEINNNQELSLVDTKINFEKTYFEIKNINYYIYYEDVDPIDDLKINARYKSFVPFNENIITNDITSFYNSNDELIFKLSSSFDLEIIIKDDTKYGVEFSNQLLYVYKDDVINVYENSNTDIETRNNIRTFTYHTVYNPETQVCNSIQICHTIKQFNEQMQYLSENDYLTLTMNELEMFLDNKIRIPVKTVVITLDDGIHLENSVSIVEKYNIYATFFVITGSADFSSYLDYEYAKFESHTDSLHNNYRCSGGYQGSQLLCEDPDIIIADLKLSQEKLNGSSYFAYPFFDYNTRLIEILKETGFKMAFVGQLGKEGFSDSETNRYMVRRKTIFGDLTLDEFVEYINASK